MKNRHFRRREKVVVFDIEIYINFLLLYFKVVGEDTTKFYILDASRSIDWNKIRAILKRYTIVTFNGTMFDLPLLYLAMQGATVSEVKDAANRIIESNAKPWEVAEMLGVHIPDYVDHIDLIEPNPSVRQSLKVLNGRLHGKWMQELPYPHDAVLTEEQKEFVTVYCRNDLEATESLYNSLLEAIAIREVVSESLDVDVRSKSDTQMGTAIIRKRIEDATGKKIGRSEFKPGTAFRYKAPSFIKFETPELQEILSKIQQHQFVTKSDGKVELPEWLSERQISIGPSAFQMGIGGLHSTEANRSVIPTAEQALVSVDVASYYPQTILGLGLFPMTVGPAFLDIYRSIRDDRIKAKKAGDKVYDKTYKIVLNGTFGVLGSRYSFLYAPHLMIAVTLTGQLALMMLIERAFMAGIPSVSANTDGVEFLCDRKFYDGLNGDRISGGKLKLVTEQWEKDTGYTLEAVEYKALYNQSVNSYYALKVDGSWKRKGPIANPWSKHKADFDPRAQLMKSPQMTICTDAALAYLTDGVPVERTINSCRDIREMVTVTQVNGGATWRGDRIGKVVRFYWAKDGDPILRCLANAQGTHGKVQKSDGCRPIMNFADDYAVPADIDRMRYIEEAYQILEDIGAGQFATAKPLIEHFVGSIIDIEIKKKRRRSLD